MSVPNERPEPSSTPIRVGLFVIVVLAFLVRLGLVPLSSGVDWDAPGYVSAARELDLLFAGRFPSVLGARAPLVYPLGLPILIRLGTPLLGSARDAGLALSLVAGTALVPLAFQLGRRLHSDAAGLLAASWVAFDPELVERSASVQSESVFAALLAAALLPLLAERLSRRGAVAAALLLVAAASVRAVGIPLAAVAIGHATLRRASAEPGAWKRFALVGVGGLILVAGVQKAVEARNAAEPYWRTLPALTLWEEGRYPNFFDVDEEGSTIFQGEHHPSLVALATEEPWLVLRVVARSGLASLRALLPFLPFALVPLLRGREGAGRARAPAALLLGLVGVAALVPIVLLQNATYMPRMVVPVRPLAFSLAAAGTLTLAAWLGARGGLALSPSARAPILVLAGLATPLALGGPFAPARAASGLRLLGSPSSPRARADRFAAEIAARVPAGARVLRGPGGDRTLIALAGRDDVQMPDTSPERLRRFCAANRLEWVLAGDVLSGGRFGDPAPVEVLRAEGVGSLAPVQVLARLPSSR